MQTGSIKTNSSLRSSVRNRYEVANVADDSSWSSTEDEADRSSARIREGINTISGQKTRIAKVKDSVTLHPGQGAWVYLTKDSEQAIGDSFIFPILLLRKIFLPRNFPPGQECYVHLQFI